MGAAGSIRGDQRQGCRSSERRRRIGPGWRDNDMRSLPHLLLVSLSLCCSGTASAQPVFRADEFLAPDRPEAWAMNYFAASTFMTAFGERPALAPGDWDVAM